MNKDSIAQVIESSKNVLFWKSKYGDLFRLGLTIRLFKDQVKSSEVNTFHHLSYWIQLYNTWAEFMEQLFEGSEKYKVAGTLRSKAKIQNIIQRVLSLSFFSLLVCPDFPLVQPET